MRLWELPSPRPRLTVGSDGAVLTLAWSADGKHVALGGEAQTVQVWTADLKQRLYEFAHEGTVHCTAFSPRGNVVASAGTGGAVYSWDMVSGKMLHKALPTTDGRSGAPGAVFALAFSPDGKHLASGGFDRRVRVWDVDTGHSAFDLVSCGRAVLCLSWSPDGNTIVSGCEARDAGLRFWDFQKGSLRNVVQGNRATGDISRVSWSPDGKTIVLGEEGGDVWFWSADLSKPPQRVLEGPYDRFAWSPDGTFLLMGSENCQLRLPDHRSGRVLFAHRQLSLISNGKRVGGTGFDYSSDGTLVALAYASANVVQVAAVPSCKILHTLDQGFGYASQLRFAPDRKTLAASEPNDGRLALWDVESGALLQTVENKNPGNPGFGCMAWSPDSTKLAAETPYGAIVADPATGKTKSWHPRRGGPAPHTASPLSWQPDGTAIASIDQDCVWVSHFDTGQGTDLFAPRWVGNWKYWDGALSWSPDCRLLLYAAYGRVVLAWNPHNGELHATLMPLDDGQPTHLIFTPDGHYCTWGAMEDAVVYVAQDKEGQQTLTPAEFSQRYGWKNDPQKARLDAVGGRAKGD